MVFGISVLDVTLSATPIAMTSISNRPQPEPTPALVPTEPPSLWLYIVLLLIAGGLVAVAFTLQPKADWAGLLSNLAAGLVGSVVILVFVDRRLRAQELAALRRLPRTTTQRFSWLVFPTSRTALRYTRNFLVSLEKLIADKIELDQFSALEAKIAKGFVLLAGPGEGKTTWTHIAAASLIRQYLDGRTTGRIPIVFALAKWLPDRTLDQALYENFSSYAPCGRWVFDRLLRSSNVVILLDGYDELWKRRLPLDTEINRLRKQFPTLAWTITSRPLVPTPTDLGETITLGAPSAEELAAIIRRQQP